MIELEFLLSASRVEQLIFDHLSHQTMNHLNGCLRAEERKVQIQNENTMYPTHTSPVLP